VKALLGLLLMTALLAGCSGKGGSSSSGGTTGPLPADKGAIAGLLIDDVYRPIPGALLLLQPAGLTATADGEGQFSFTDLEPGAYVLQASAGGHEAAPRQVDVVAGQYAEVEMMARRIINEGSRVITNEYSIFMTCTMEAVVVSGNGLNCFMDLSGDSERTSFDTDLRGVRNVTYAVSEIRFNKVDDYDFVLAIDDDGDAILDRYWAEASIDNGDYAKVVLQNGTANTENDAGRNLKWQPDVDPWRTTVFPHGELYTELAGAAGTYGAGVDFGVRGTIIQSVFIGEPDVDIATYCVLCS
jgi:hypothetical protein